MTHSISGAFGWKMLEENSPVIAALIAVAPASPGNMGEQLGVLVRDEGTRKRVDMPSGETVIDLGRVLNLPAEFHRAKLVGSSTRFPAEAMDSYFQSLLGIAGRIVFERTNIGGGQLRVGDTSGFSNKPVLVVTGTEDTDHSRALDGEIVEWLNRAGARAEFLYLGDLGIEGNGHMMMLEHNSDEIAKTMMNWLETSLGGETP
jgi:pimeloyl-ACP methyl ester carboxylesterase